MDIDWKGIVRSVAPVIGTALGGPLAGTAVKFLADGLLGNPNATEQDIAETILNATPEQLLKLRQLDVDFKLRMRELDINVFKMEVDDRQGARELARTDMRPQIVLSVIYTAGYFVMVYLFMTGKVNVLTELKAEFNIVLGVMTAAQVKIMDFWFGSSFGSKTKDAALAGSKPA